MKCAAYNVDDDDNAMHHTGGGWVGAALEFYVVVVRTCDTCIQCLADAVACVCV